MAPPSTEGWPRERAQLESCTRYLARAQPCSTGMRAGLTCGCTTMRSAGVRISGIEQGKSARSCGTADELVGARLLTNTSAHEVIGMRY